MYYILFSLLPLLFAFFPIPAIPHVPMLHASYMLQGPQAAQWRNTEEMLNAMRQSAVVLALLSLTLHVIERQIPVMWRVSGRWYHFARACQQRHIEAADITCTQILVVCLLSYYRTNFLIHG